MIKQMQILFLTFSLFLWLASSSFGASIYGTFELKQGEARIIHNSNLKVVNEPTLIDIYENDTIQLGQESKGVLKGKDKAVVNIGSNAVLRVRAWKQQNSQGFLSLIYGKIQAAIAGLRADESFNVKTANSIIGVKGTEYNGGVNSRGDTYTWAQQDFVYLTDTQLNKQAIVPQGYYVTNFNNQGLQAMIAVDESLQQEAQNVESAPSGSAEANEKLDSFFEPSEEIGSIDYRQLSDVDEVVREVQSAAPQTAGGTRTIEINFNLKP